MRKLEKRYYVLIFVAVIAFGSIIRESNGISYKITQNQTVYAPEAEEIIIEEAEITDFKININTAALPELTLLPGVGESLGLRIIEYRTRYGDFEVIEDIMKVTGIGEKKFDEMKKHLAVAD